MKSRTLLVFLALLLPAAAAAPGAHAATADPPGRALGRGGAERHDAAVSVAWFDLLYGLVRAERLSPPVASRRIGYAGVALYESIAPGVPGGRSLAGQLNGLEEVPGVEPHAKYHWPAVAGAALADVLRGLFAGASAESLAAIDLLEQDTAAALRTRAPAPVLARSEARGRAVAAAILAWAATDGLAEHDNCPYTPAGEGLWQPTPPAFAAPLQPCWGRLRPFVLVSGAECDPGAHPGYSTDPASAFYAEGREVYDTTSTLTPGQLAIALFWADNPGQTGTPPGHWIAIVGQVARASNLSLDVAAEAYARTGMAVADGFISCWDSKYRFNLMRPITYIRAVFDPVWTPPIGTPPFPEYTSGHSVQSAAAATVLGDLLGPLPFTDDTHAPLGLPARSFGSFEEAAAEAAVSRLYGGIHYRAAIDNGLDQGRCIGETILREVRFR
jgi:hypothetical protein